MAIHHARRWTSDEMAAARRPRRQSLDCSGRRTAALASGTNRAAPAGTTP